MKPNRLISCFLKWKGESELVVICLMQTKLKEMEARLKSKEATMYESDGVAAKVARDRQGNFVFQFDKDR